jgi:hypothetical protein
MIVDDNGGAGFGQRQCVRAADTAAGTGDDRDLALQ